MKLPREEEAARKAAYKKMRPAEKLDYIVSYYKGQLILICLALFILVWIIVHFAMKKEPVLYLGLLNLSVSDETVELLTKEFLEEQGYNPGKYEVVFYPALYISEDPAAQNHEYAYASQLKLMASLNAKTMDLMIMNREAYDRLSGQRYLADLEVLLAPENLADRKELPEEDRDILAGLASWLVRNSVILSDNSIEYRLGEAEELIIEEEEHTNALEITHMPRVEGIGFSGDVYIGIAANSERIKECISYIRYLSDLK